MNKSPLSRNGEALIANVMTADIAQAVGVLRDALRKVDALDQEIARINGGASSVAAEEIRKRREKARAKLRTARAELDTVLLGDV